MSLQVQKCPTCGSELVQPRLSPCSDAFHVLKPTEVERLRARVAELEARERRLREAIGRIRAFPSVRTSATIMDVIQDVLAAAAPPAKEAQP